MCIVHIIILKYYTIHFKFLRPIVIKLVIQRNIKQRINYAMMKSIDPESEPIKI